MALNSQRQKTPADLIREQIAGCTVDPDEAYWDLVADRRERAEDAVLNAPALASGERRARKPISAAKRPMLDAILAIVEEYEAEWPLSDRQVHYLLLPDPPLRNAGDPASRYANDLRSYKDTSDMHTRARLEGEVEWEAIADTTRPHTSWRCYPSVGPFARDQIGQLFRGYARDLLQSQPCHVELLA